MSFKCEKHNRENNFGICIEKKCEQKDSRILCQLCHIDQHRDHQFLTRSLLDTNDKYIIEYLFGRQQSVMFQKMKQVDYVNQNLCEKFDEYQVKVQKRFAMQQQKQKELFIKQIKNIKGLFRQLFNIDVINDKYIEITNSNDNGMVDELVTIINQYKNVNYDKI